MNNGSYNNNSNNGDDNDNNPLDNENHVKRVNSAKNAVFILRDSIVKIVNRYLLKKKLQNKKLIKVRSSSGAKVSCMYDHVKPTIRKFNPNHIILHVGTNKLNSSQISRSVIDLALSLKLETDTVTISLTVPQKDNLKHKK